ncbi:DUF1176 domain-containing protein [Psychrobacter sp. 16-MNA-CIBAN-0192]|uniref:DUF1176 domain-containing protein n=1 Tax=Psychrobacter sp. 16-MNA-CIBAN-0192 TaxID=3140448 RepID=UPI00332F664A
MIQKIITSFQSTSFTLNKVFLLCAAAVGVTVSLPSMAAAPVEFSNQDWQVVCDNTRTCRLAGYQAEDRNDLPVSVLLIRRAGANAGVIGKVKLGGAKDSSSKALLQLGSRHRISLFINDKDLGETKAFSTASGDADLTSAQVTALLDALSKSSKIELVLRNTHWRLSDKGATAVMLKADEAQGRIGTASAFINSATVTKANNRVLPPKAAPKLRLVQPNTKIAASGNKKFSMKSSQLASLMQETMKDVSGDCPNLTDNSPWRVSRLNANKLLIQHGCWLSAYNSGTGAWVMNDSPPYNPVLVTTSATDYDNGKISAVHKGRGLGDCLNQTYWVWTGTRFTKSHESSTGLCRLVEVGGAWRMPTYVTEVQITR